MGLWYSHFPINRKNQNKCEIMQAIKQNFNIIFIAVLHFTLAHCYWELFWFRYLKTVKPDLLIFALVKLLQIRAVKSSKSFTIAFVFTWSDLLFQIPDAGRKLNCSSVAVTLITKNCIMSGIFVILSIWYLLKDTKVSVYVIPINCLVRWIISSHCYH